MSIPLNPSGASTYTTFGSTPSNSLVNAVRATRAPAVTDTRGAQGNYVIGQRWIDTSALATYTLGNFTASAGVIGSVWITDGGGSSALATLSGNTGTATPVGGNILIAGTSPISTVASGSTVTVSTTAVSSVPTQSGTATPSSNAVTINGAGGLTTSATGSTVIVSAGTSASVGSWTPVLNIGGSTTGITYSVQQGFYYQLGPIVWFSCHINLTSKGAQVGTLAITGLPVAGGISSNDFTGIISYYDNLTMDVNFVTPVWQANTTNLILWEVGSAQTTTRLTEVSLANTTVMIFEGFYFIN